MQLRRKKKDNLYSLLGCNSYFIFSNFSFNILRLDSSLRREGVFLVDLSRVGHVAARVSVSHSTFRGRDEGI